MNRRKLVMVLAGALVCATWNMVLAAEDQVAQYEKRLSSAKKEVEAYKKNLMEGALVGVMKKEMAELDASTKFKDKELAALLDARLEKNPVYLELAEKAKELEGLDFELRRLRRAIEADPGVKALQKEAQDLRAKATAKDQEARRLADSKFNSDQKVKGMLAQKALVANAGRETADFKKNVMNEPQIKALQAESADLKKRLITKTNQSRAAIDNLLKTDVRLKALEVRVTELNKQTSELRKGKRIPARTIGQKTQPAPAQTPRGESLLNRLKRRLGKK